MRQRDYAYRTEQTYFGWIRRFYSFVAPKQTSALTTADAELRQTVAAMQARADAELADPKLPTPCRKVLASLQEHWDGLTRFVDDPRIPLDNNASERQVRGPALGRKKEGPPCPILHPPRRPLNSATSSGLSSSTPGRSPRSPSPPTTSPAPAGTATDPSTAQGTVVVSSPTVTRAAVHAQGAPVSGRSTRTRAVNACAGPRGNTSATIRFSTG